MNPIQLPSTIGETQPFSKYPGIRFGEKPPYTETYTLEGVEVRRTLYCNWSDAELFPVAMMGDVETGNGDGSLKRYLPHRHPHRDKNLFCVQCDLLNGAGGFYKDGNSGLISFQDSTSPNLDGLAEWQVTYRQLPYDVLPDDPKQGGSELYRFVQREVKYATEGYPVPGLAFAWQTTAYPLPEPATIRRMILELRYTWHMVPEPMPAVLTASGPGGDAAPNDGVVLGRMNNRTFDKGGPIRFEGFPPFHLLCEDMEQSDRFHTASGTPFRNITYSFLFRPDSAWDEFWMESLGRFERLIPNEYAQTLKIRTNKGGQVDEQGVRFLTMKVRVKGRRPYDPGLFDELFGYK